MVHDAFVDLNGLRFHYRDWGDYSRHFVLLHGLASTTHIWNLTAPLLAQRFRLFALDQRGHGQSAKPEDGYDFSSIVGDLSAFIEALDLKRPVIVGHSWGGNVAIQFAVDYPQAAAGLVLADGGFLELSASMSWERAERELAPPHFEGMLMDDFLAQASSSRATDLGWSPEMREIVLANFDLGKDGTIRPRLRRESHLKILRALYDQKPSRLYDKVRCPVLMVPATREPEDDRSRRWLRAKRHSVDQAQRLLQKREVLWMEDTVHDIPLHRPRELAAAVADFALGLT